VTGGFAPARDHEVARVIAHSLPALTARAYRSPLRARTLACRHTPSCASCGSRFITRHLQEATGGQDVK